jgi:CheY-like chemotaxis protein/two-component sensor histidine kinase
MVRQNNFDEATMRRAFEVTERNARNQNQIISDILDVSRIITGKLHLNLQPVALASLVEAAVETVRPLLAAKNLSLTLDLAGDDAMIAGDAERLQQIVWNLLTNAVKFTPDGGEIAVRLRRAETDALLTVADNGDGIEPDFLPFVFDRFRQADGKTNRRHGGLGLGLAIVRHLTEMHGGSVRVDSGGAGSGARFTIRLPLEARQSAAGENDLKESLIAVEGDAPGGEAPRRRLEGIKILVVDDEPDALELTRFILAEEGAIVATANSADGAFALLLHAGEEIDFLISDIGMPEKDGYELIRTIRERAAQLDRPLKTVALTAYAGEKDKRRALEAGFHAYLPKPVEPPALIEIISDLHSI